MKGMKDTRVKRQWRTRKGIWTEMGLEGGGHRKKEHDKLHNGSVRLTYIAAVCAVSVLDTHQAVKRFTIYFSSKRNW